MKDPFTDIPPLPPGYAWRADRRLMHYDSAAGTCTEVFPWLPVGHILYVEICESARGQTRVALHHFAPETGWDVTFTYPN